MMLSLTPIVEKLKAAGMRNTEGVLEFGGQTVPPRALPAYFVVPLAEDTRGNANDRVGVVDQKVIAGFSVMIVLAGAQRRTNAIGEDLSAEIKRVTETLLGWKHPEASGLCSYAGGRLASADGSTVVWAVRFNSPYHLRKAS